MKIITCASYYGTGSSAITDLLAEYNTCKSLGNYEFRFIQDPEGVSDLEFNLVQNHHRHNSGHSLKRYRNKVDFLAGNRLINKYEPFFNNRWKIYSYEYIDELTEFVYKGYWHQDIIDKGTFFYYRKRFLNKILTMTIWRNKEKGLYELPNEITICSSPTEDDFLLYTRRYIDKLFAEANKENRPNIVVDQLVPPSNIQRYIRYFNNIFVFVVDRDPRDIFILEKYVWKGSVVPVENVETFCKWYRYTRKHRKLENNTLKNVMYVQFEDLIYKYNETVSSIQNELGLDEMNHTEKFKSFNPMVSIGNTRLWERYKISDVDKDYIETHLFEYLYKY